MKGLTHSSVRYGISGGLSVGIEYLVFLFFNQLHNPLVVANSISCLVGLVISFFLHKYWSFGGTQQHQTRAQFLGYITLAGINLVLTNVLIVFLVNILGVAPEIAKLLVMATVVIWNFLIMKKLLFKASA